MGQKVNPIGLRLGVNKTWKSKWYVDPREYADTLHEDLKLRKALVECPEVQGAEISDVEIIRKPQRITIVITTSRPGIIIGSKGANVEKLGVRLQKLSDKKVQIKIKEIKKPEADAQLIALNVARQLVSRGSFRRSMKMAVSKAMQNGAQGVKIRLSGRIGGAEIARSEWMKEGRIPLHTLRSDIDYGFTTANTSFGVIGVKVWVYNGEIYDRAVKNDAGGLVKKPTKSDGVEARS
ncbi:30S ribosomal protein S3 [Sphaerochaeta halotolerans]|jgi:small subunit ribosomal protein S3|uniref:Small ribosomal subunit protein uS3 n=1 Tax=Sphaerochaeta halotolerans TaxID=2293840 RepID=A0A372MJY6_9SPIR|nr:30S ribosomal protein S3 [Sphaerochaeta halotolerans]MBG0766001.1 30S ribosomal protein S3 [Spirochaetaceae bacterium]MDK2858935.1 small subunit ribosomal protein [Sphaerochaeta sp.]MDN5333038.1 small subunit ribosomal protein [Sphaerochaeta sp.]MXI87153.1 30S ribosomal protein S3 [Sphaerochaeta halotolerans]RFU95490.1 30S ribosomal protein S3 [Sphaerochaeta halotolerans]